MARSTPNYIPPFDRMKTEMAFNNVIHMFNINQKHLWQQSVALLLALDPPHETIAVRVYNIVYILLLFNPLWKF
jgi:hypothetical protein